MVLNPNVCPIDPFKLLTCLRFVETRKVYITGKLRTINCQGCFEILHLQKSIYISSIHPVFHSRPSTHSDTLPSCHVLNFSILGKFFQQKTF